VPGAVRLARGRDENPVAVAKDIQTFADLEVAADLPPTLGPREGDAAPLAGHGTKRVKPAPVIAAEIEEGGQSFTAIDVENENAGVRPGDKSPIRRVARPAPQLLQIVRCLGAIRSRHSKMLAGRNGEEPPALPHCGTINLDRNPVDIERFVSGKTANCFNGTRTLLECFYEQVGWLHSDVFSFKNRKPAALSP
jgi:hypothetical protein